MAYHRQQGVNTAIVRIFNTYGPRMRANDGRAIPTFLRQALEGKPVTVFGDGSQTRSFCYVDDLIRGIVLLAESDEHLPVNLGNPDEKTLLELAEVDPPAHGLVERDRLRGAAGRRSPGAPAGHHARAADPGLGAGDRARGRPAQDDRRLSAARPPSAPRERSLGERYEEHHRERRDEGDFVFVPERIPLFQAAIGRGKRVLDLGCRSGALTQHFLEGNSVVGLDVDAAALEKAAALGIEPVQANVEEPLPFEDASFDAVVAGELFEHLQFPDALVAEIRRVLRPGGVVVGSVPNAFRAPEPSALPARPAARGRPDAPAHVLARRAARAARRLRERASSTTSAAATRGCTHGCSPATSSSAASGSRRSGAAERGASRDVGLVDHVAVALDVAAFAAHDEDHEIVRLARVRHPARRRRLDVESPPGPRIRSSPSTSRAPRPSGRSRARPGCRGSGGSPRSLADTRSRSPRTPSRRAACGSCGSRSPRRARRASRMRVPSSSPFRRAGSRRYVRRPSSKSTCGS